MPDSKITALTSIGTSTDPANDPLVIVDVSDTSMAASGTTKKVSLNNLLACSPSATLASATITGDLTVDTNTLKVDSANNRVGIGTASPTQILTIQGAANQAFLQANDSTAVYQAIYGVDSVTGGGVLGCISNHPVIFRVNNTEAMRLNSTGLGIGASPDTGFRLTVKASRALARLESTTGTEDAFYQLKNTGGTFAIGIDNSTGANQTGVGYATYLWGSGAYPFIVATNNAERFRIDSSGNVGVGVTPSAWFASAFGPVVQFKSAGSSGGGALTGSGADNFRMFANTYYDSTSQYKHIVAGFATQYEQAAGKHAWYTSTTSGALNGVITFTQAMTLAANGQLLLGTSSTNGAVDIGMVMNKPSATGFVGNVYQLNSVDKAFTYIASAVSAYRIDTVAGYTVNVVSSTNGVYLANGGTSWLSLSDERFKDIIEPISNAVAKVGSLRSVIGKFKSEAEGTRRSFLLAQDVQAVLPEAVDATKPEQLGLSYPDVIPLLVAAIQELTAEVNALKNA